jgi:hypothetical protein
MPTKASIVATYTFGVAPATLLVPFAVFSGVVGVQALFTVRDPVAALKCLLLVMAAVLAVYGYMALLHTARAPMTPKIARWLGGGIVANLVGIAFLFDWAPWFSLAGWFLLLSPLIVGSTHVVYFYVDSRQRGASV